MKQDTKLSEVIVPMINKGFEAYKSNNPDCSEFMESDYKAGFEDGYKAAFDKCFSSLETMLSPVHVECDHPQFIASPRLTIAIAAMQGFLSNHLWMSNVVKNALHEETVYGKDANEIVKNTIIKDSLELADALLECATQEKK